MRPEDYYACVLLILSFVPFSIVVTVCDWSGIHLCCIIRLPGVLFFIFHLITVSLVSAVWMNVTNAVTRFFVSNQTLLRTAVCLPSVRALTPVAPVDDPASEKKIWLLNKSTALICCNYSNNNNKKPTGKQTEVFSFVCSAHSWRNSSKGEVLHPGLACCLQNLI